MNADIIISELDRRLGIIANLTAQHTDATQSLCTYCTSIAPQINPIDVIAVARYMYWHTDVNTCLIAGLFGKPRITQTIREEIGPIAMPFACGRCKRTVYVNSRTSYASYTLEGTSHLCPTCRRDIADAQRESYRAECDERDRQDEAYINELRTIPYRQYLSTEHWRNMRGYTLRRAKYRCQLCNTGGIELHVHHRTYERRGNEDYGDLIVLCDPCHSKFHNKLPKEPP